MASIGDIYQAKVTTLMNQGQTALTVMYYEVVSGGASLTAENVADEIDTNILAAMQAAMSIQNSINRIFTINGMDNSDFNDTNPNRTGTRTGFSPPLMLAAGIRGPWPGPGYHRARHNLPVGSMTALQDDGLWNAAFKTELLALAQLFGDVLVNANGNVSPITIQGSFTLGVSPTKRADAVGDWDVNDFSTTMKSRQPYFWSGP